MTEEKFNEINSLFNSLISEQDLKDETTHIDGESILSRTFKKSKNLIDHKILSSLIVLNKHIVDEQYEAASEFKKYILSNY